jgi:hypothetical protein
MNNWGPALIVLLGIAGGVLYSNSRITDLKDAMTKRSDDLKDSMNKRFDDLRDLLKSEVKRLEERIAHTRV